MGNDFRIFSAWSEWRDLGYDFCLLKVFSEIFSLRVHILNERLASRVLIAVSSSIILGSVVYESDSFSLPWHHWQSTIVFKIINQDFNSIKSPHILHDIIHRSKQIFSQNYSMWARGSFLLLRVIWWEFISMLIPYHEIIKSNNRCRLLFYSSLLNFIFLVE